MGIKNKWSNIYRFSLFFSVLGLLAASTGFTPWVRHTNFLVGIFFYLPFLWLLWICCALLSKGKLPSAELWLLWWIINFTELVLFSSYSMRVDHWAHAKGGDLAVLIAYFPIVMPIILVFTLVPKDMVSQLFDLLVKLFGGGGRGWRCSLGIFYNYCTFSIIDNFTIC